MRLDGRHSVLEHDWPCPEVCKALAMSRLRKKQQVSKRNGGARRKQCYKDGRFSNLLRGSSCLQYRQTQCNSQRLKTHETRIETDETPGGSKRRFARALMPFN